MTGPGSQLAAANLLNHGPRPNPDISGIYICMGEPAGAPAGRHPPLIGGGRLPRSANVERPGWQ